MVISSFSYCRYVTLEVTAAFFQLKIGMKIIIEHNQLSDLLCVAQVSDLYMKVNKLKVFTFILDIIFDTNRKMTLNTVHWESMLAILLHCHCFCLTCFAEMHLLTTFTFRFRLNMVPEELIKAWKNLKVYTRGWAEGNSVLSRAGKSHVLGSDI